MWNINDIIACTQGVAHNISSSTPIKRFVIHTQHIKPHDIFVALPPTPHKHGGLYIPEAERLRAIILYDHSTPTLPSPDTPSIQVPCILSALKKLAHFKLHKDNSKKILITGSHGKTTTKYILQHISPRATYSNLKNLNTSISVGLAILNQPNSPPISIFELGVSQIGEMDKTLAYFPEKSCDVAIITSIAPVHMEGFGSIDNIICEKVKIFQRLHKKGVVICEGDRPHTPHILEAAKPYRVATFGESTECLFYAHHITSTPDITTHFQLQSPAGEFSVTSPLMGKHMVRNITASIAALLSASAENTPPLPDVIASLKTMEPCTARGQIHVFSHGIICDYSYSAGSIDAIESNLQAFATIPSEASFAIIGDMAEQGHERYRQIHAELYQSLSRHLIHKIYLVGPIMQSLVPASQHFIHATNYEDVVNAITKHLVPNSKIFIQGSRHFRLEDCVQLIKKHDQNHH